MKIGAASLNQTPLDWGNNKRNIITAIELAKKDGVDLLSLPEMCVTGYGCEDLFLHGWVAEKALNILFEILPETKNIAVTLGLPINFQGTIYNVVCLIENDHILGFQAKQNLPKDGVHYEPRWFEPWKAKRIESIEINNVSYPFGDKTYKVKGVKVGFEICEDAWVTDRPACRLVEEKVDIILNPSASHFSMVKSLSREQKAVDASKEFSCTYVFSNQLGNEAGRIIYDGDAYIAHKGQLLASNPLFSFNPVELTWSEIDYSTGLVSNKNILAVHGSKEEQFIEATSLGLYDYLRKSNSNGFVLSLSGGADSSTCLILLSEMVKRGVNALGANKFLETIGLADKQETLISIEDINQELITVAYQATDHSSVKTFDSAETLAKSINARFHNWSINDEITHARKIIESIVERKLTWEADDIVLQNIQARSRAPIIWMLANLQNSLLITTSNRSEGSVGYTTMDGDTSGSLAPIAGVDKPFIIHWLKWAEKNLGYSALSKVNSLIPTAELRPISQFQSDESDLMPYEILNRIEELFLKNQMSPLAIQEELAKSIPNSQAAEYVIKFFKLWSRNQWKRERLAPSFQLDQYNIDPRSWFRFPILSGGFKNELDELHKLIR
jgi:NAD+ synthase (glutamine-hydrolysing)